MYLASVKKTLHVTLENIIEFCYFENLMRPLHNWKYVSLMQNCIPPSAFVMCQQ